MKTISINLNQLWNALTNDGELDIFLEKSQLKNLCIEVANKNGFSVDFTTNPLQAAACIDEETREIDPGWDAALNEHINSL